MGALNPGKPQWKSDPVWSKVPVPAATVNQRAYPKGTP